MPTLHEIYTEIKTKQTSSAADLVRRKYLKKLSNLTGRPTILYATSFTIKDIGGDVLTINRQDIQAFMSALYKLEGEELDLILHSPGGQAEATEQIVNYLREKFRRIRIIVPQNAMSAATMLACAGDVILMGKHSALGPIDPQLRFGSSHTAPAQSILDEFEEAQVRINQGNNPIMWVKRIGQYPPGILADCKKVIQLSKELVRDWLATYMFAGESNAPDKAGEIAEWLGDNRNFLTHGRSIGIQAATAKGLKIELLENNQDLQEAVLSVFHATVATFQATACVKIVENHLGKGSFTLAQPK